MLFVSNTLELSTLAFFLNDCKAFLSVIYSSLNYTRLIYYKSTTSR